MNYAERLPVGLSRRESDILAMRVLSCKNHRWSDRVDKAVARRLKTRLAAMDIPMTVMSLDGYAIRF